MGPYNLFRMSSKVFPPFPSSVATNNPLNQQRALLLLLKTLLNALVHYLVPCLAVTLTQKMFVRKCGSHSQTKLQNPKRLRRSSVVITPINSKSATIRNIRRRYIAYSCSPKFDRLPTSGSLNSEASCSNCSTRVRANCTACMEVNDMKRHNIRQAVSTLTCSKYSSIVFCLSFSC